jgi:chromosome segregation ATPase
MLVGGTERILTAVRCRPMSWKELREDDRPIVLVDDEDEDKLGEVVILDPTYFARKRDYERTFFERAFRYDHSFLPDSTQQDVYEMIGKPLLKHSFEGYNACLLVYGQTGSGKTYTMIGDQGDRSNSSAPGADEPAPEDLEGIVPRLCRALLHEVFLRTAAAATSASINGVVAAAGENPSSEKDKPITGGDGMLLVDAKVLASFFEIYNEKVFDLLSETPSTPCRIREHPENGAFVEGLRRYQVNSFEDADGLIGVGLEQRAVAETRMNKMSSRSHAVFTLYLKQKLQDPKHARSHKKSDHSIFTERMSKITLVDLAGSERVSLTGATGERLVEANNINRSLSTLSDVIKSLSDKGAALEREREKLEQGGDDPLNTSSDSLRNLLTAGNRAKGIFIPYRNSVLTWLLKDCLGGNARTAMLANIGPSESSFNETMSTLRYVERAKLIMNTVRVNETSTDPAFVLQLQKHIVSLQSKITNLNKAQSLRDVELQVHLEAQQKEMEKEFILRTIELQDQLHYYQSNNPSLEGGGGADGKGAAGGATPGHGGSGSSNDAKHQHEISLLSAEVERLTAQLVQKEAIITEYEARVLPSLEAAAAAGTSKDSYTPASVATGERTVTFSTPLRSGDNGSDEAALETPATGSSTATAGGSNGNSSGAMARMRALVLGYKKEKNLVQQQYEALLLKVRDATATIEESKSHHTRLDVTKNTLQADLSLSRADRNRLKSELAARVEEVNTHRSEVDFYRARFEALGAENKRKLGLMELHINRMKEAEGVMRHEKEEYLDRITHLMAKQSERDAEWEAKIKALAAEDTTRIEDLEASLEELNGVKEGLERQVVIFTSDVADLRKQLSDAEEAVAAAGTSVAEKEKEVKSTLESVAVLRTECAQKGTEIDTFTAQVTKLQQSKEALNAELIESVQKNSDLEEELQRDRQALHRLHATLEGVEHESQEAEKQMRGLSQGFNEALRKSDEEIEKLHDDFQRRMEAQAALLADKNRLESELKALQEEVAKRVEEERQQEAAAAELVAGLRGQMTSLEKEKAEEEQRKADELCELEKKKADELAELAKKKADEMSELEKKRAIELETLKSEVARSEEHARALEGESLVKSKGLFGQLDKLSVELKDWKEKHSEVASALERTKTELEAARAEIDKDENALKDKNAEHEHDLDEIHKYEDTVKNTQKALDEKNAEAVKLQTECEETGKKLAKKTADADSLEAELRDARAKAEAEIADLTKAKKAKVEALESELKEASAKLTKKTADADSLEAELRDARAKAEAEIADLTKRLRATQSEFEQDHNKEEKLIQEKDKQLEMRKEAMRAVSEQLNRTEAELAEAQAQVRELEEKEEESQFRQAELEKSVSASEEQLRATSGRLDEMTETARNADDVIVTLNRKIKSLQGELHDGDLLVKDIVKKHEKTKRELEFLQSGGGSIVAESMKRELEELHEARQDMEVELESEKEKEDMLEKIAEELESENMSLEKELAKEKAHELELEQALAREKQVEETLQKEVDGLTTRLHASEEREKKLRDALNSAEGTTPPPVPPSEEAEEFAAQVVVAELREKLANAESAGENLAQQVPSLQAEVKDLTSQLQQAHDQLAAASAASSDSDAAARVISGLKSQVEELEQARAAAGGYNYPHPAAAAQASLQNRNQELLADISRLEDAQAEHEMVSGVYKDEISALTNSVTELTAQLVAEKEKVDKLTAMAADGDAVVVSVQKQEQEGGDGSGGASSGPTHAEMEDLTNHLIEAKMALATQSSEKFDLEDQLQQSEKMCRDLNTELSDLRLKVGSLTASLRAEELRKK